MPSDTYRLGPRHGLATAFSDVNIGTQQGLDGSTEQSRYHGRFLANSYAAVRPITGLDVNLNLLMLSPSASEEVIQDEHVERYSMSEVQHGVAQRCPQSAEKRGNRDRMHGMSFVDAQVGTRLSSASLGNAPRHQLARLPFDGGSLKCAVNTHQAQLGKLTFCVYHNFESQPRKQHLNVFLPATQIVSDPIDGENEEFMLVRGPAKLVIVRTVNDQAFYG